MLAYEYKCDKCGTIFTDEPRVIDQDQQTQITCPRCNSTEVKQLIADVDVQAPKKTSSS